VSKPKQPEKAPPDPEPRDIHIEGGTVWMWAPAAKADEEGIWIALPRISAGATGGGRVEPITSAAKVKDGVLGHPTHQVGITRPGEKYRHGG